jgi:predicted DNA binding CopG/RHH family protein
MTKTPIKLDDEERALLESYETEDWVTIDTFVSDVQAYADYARHTLARDHAITIHLTASDLEKLQVKAVEEGLSMRSLVASILHKYAVGRLIERSPG